MNSFLKKSNSLLNYSKVLKGNLNNIPKFGFLTRNIMNTKLAFQSYEINFNQNEIKKQNLNFMKMNKKYFSEKDNKEPEKNDKKKDEDKEKKEEKKEENKDEKKDENKDEKKEEKEKEKSEEEKNKEKEKGKLNLTIK